MVVFKQLLDFIDNIDTTVHKHLVMFYEEAEYAKSIQVRFLKAGFEKRECVVYAARDDDDLYLTKETMREYGIDIENSSSKGLLQFYMQKPPIDDVESYKRAIDLFNQEITRNYSMANGKNGSPTLPRIRGVGSMFRDIFASVENYSSNKSQVTTQLLMEELFQKANTSSFKDSWMCAYQVESIMEQLDKPWMESLLMSHDAVLFLPKFSNGLALDLKG